MTRLQTLQSQISKNKAFLLSSPGDIRYFSGFEFLVPYEREALLLVTEQSATLLHASFSPVSTPAEIVCVPGCYPSKLKAQVKEIIKSENLKEIFIDKETLFVEELEQLQSIKKLKISPLDRNIIWLQRSIKSPREIENIHHACQITSKAVRWAKNQLKPGISEIQLEEMLEDKLKALGSTAPAFPTIVAFGKHTALPHHQPTHFELKENTPVLIDAGATYQGYCADMTRSFWYGEKPDPKYIAIEDIVIQAYNAALKALKPGKETIKAIDVDKAARDLITDKGYGQQFIHTTGHSLGVDIHEQPSLSWANSDEIKDNMTVTVEPGIYLERLFGYRYENTVLVGREIEELTLLT